MRGHAVEVRLYAEVPTAGWRPSTGRLHRIAVPGVDVTFGPGHGERGLRLDSGVQDGSEVSPHYDPMLAKLVAWAPTRDEAIRRLSAALAGARLHGVTTNRDLLVRVLGHPAFAAGQTDTGFLDAHPDLFTPLAGPAEVEEAALAAALAASARRRSTAPVLRGLPAGWRNNPSQPATAAYQAPSGTIEVAYRPAPRGTTVVESTPDRVVLEREGIRRTYAVNAVAAASYVDGPGWSVTLSEVDPLPEPSTLLPVGSLTAPMPGLVLAVHVAEGDSVVGGQPVLALEAMKMEHAVVAPTDGTVAELRVAAGSQVDAGAVLAVITGPAPTRPGPAAPSGTHRGGTS